MKPPTATRTPTRGYDGRHAMGVGDAPDRPTLFAVQSTHEMLPALSMASMIHGRSSPRAPVDARSSTSRS